MSLNITPNHLTAIITLNRSAKIRVKTPVEFGRATVSEQTDNGDSVLFFDTDPGFQVDDSIVDFYGGTWQGWNVYDVTITDISYNTGTELWEVTLSDPVTGDVVVGTEVRVVRDSEREVMLSPDVVNWIDVDDPYNVKALNHHAAIGQTLTIGDWGVGNAWYPVLPPFVDLKTDEWFLYLISLNRSAKIRVKGFQWDPNVENPTWQHDGYHYLKTDYATRINLGPEHENIVTVNATGGTFTLSYDGETTSNIPSDASAEEVADALANAWGTSRNANVDVTGPNGGPWNVAIHSVYIVNSALTIDDTNLTGPDASGTVVETAAQGTRNWMYNRQQLNHHRSIGQFLQGWNSDFYVGLKALNGTAKTRVWSSNPNAYDGRLDDHYADLLPIGCKYNVTYAEIVDYNATLTLDSAHKIRVGDQVDVNIGIGNYDYAYGNVVAVTENTITFISNAETSAGEEVTGTVAASATFVEPRYNSHASETRKRLNSHNSIGQWIVTDFYSFD